MASIVVLAGGPSARSRTVAVIKSAVEEIAAALPVTVEVRR